MVIQSLLVVVLTAVGVLSLPIEGRLWRAGRISDRTMAILVVGRAPVGVFLFGLIQGYAAPLVLGTTALVTVPGVALYWVVLAGIREQALSRRRS